MSQFSWESGVAEESKSETQALETAPPAANLALTPDDFSGLEERIHRAVNLVKRGRADSAAAQERAVQAESKLREQAPVIEGLQKEVSALRAERDHVRQRVEKLLAQLDELEL